MNDKTLRFRIGLFVLITMILLGILVTWFTGAPTFFKRYNHYTILFDDAPGVAQGTPVRRSGVRIGEVASVKLDEESGKVRVDVLIDRDHPMRLNERPTLTHGILGGDTTIDLIARARNGEVPDRSPIPPNSEIQGVQLADARILLNQASEIMPTTEDALKDIRRVANRLDQMTPLMEETVREYRDLARATREMVPELRRTNEEVRELAKATRETVPELRRTNEEILVTARNWGRLGERLDVLLQTNQEKLVKSLDSFNEVLVRMSRLFDDENQRNLAATLKNVRNASDSLGSVTKNTDELLKESLTTVRRVNESITQADQVLANLQQATKPMAERSASIMKNLDESTGQLSRTLVDVRELLRQVGRGDGTLQRLMSDPALYNNLNDITCMAAKILPRVDNALRDLEVFADKIARHPELIGLSGMVRPSSGLKEAPSQNTSHRPPH